MPRSAPFGRSVDVTAGDGRRKKGAMPSVIVNLLESETGPAGAYPPDYTAYRFTLRGLDGWLTGIRNMTLGPLWFPRSGLSSYDVRDPQTVVKLESFASLSPQDIAAVYGSAIPAFPLEIVALSGYVNPHIGDPGSDAWPSVTGTKDSSADSEDDLDPSEGGAPDIVYEQVQVE